MTDQSSRKFRLYSFVFTLVVIGYHARLPFLAEYDIVRSVYPYILRMYNYLCSIAMSYFFMTSGYMLYYGITIENARQRFIRRIRSLLIPYFVWNLIYMGIYLVFRRDFFKDGVMAFVRGFTIDPFNGPFWYVLTIFALSALVGPVLRLRQARIQILTTICLLLVILSIAVQGFGLFNLLGFSEDELAIDWFVRFFRYLPAYMLGCWFGLEHSGYVDIKLKGRYRFGLVCLVIVITGMMLCFSEVPKIWQQINLIFQPVLLWLIVNCGALRLKGDQAVRGSFMMYAMHTAIIMVVRYFLERTFSNDLDGLYVFLIWLLFPFAMMLLVYFVAYMLTLLMDKYHLSFLKLALTGDRR